ncbi:MAG: ABC transporter ATP-binding protein [Saprospiraceae bacterium]
MIVIKALEKAFGKNETLKGIDLELNAPGRITAILGPNGSGKTTLIKALLGMVLPDKGEIRVLGDPVRGRWKYRSHINYLPQIARFPENLSVQELILMIRDIRGGEADDIRLIRHFGLEAYLDKRLANLSGGTRQKVNLTLAFMYDSPLVILDEPTSGLDPVAMIQLRALIQREKQKGKIILITTHIMSFVEEIADEIVFLLEGRIYFRGSLQMLKETYGGSSVEQAIATILNGSAIQTPDTLSPQHHQILASQPRFQPTGLYAG